MVQLDVEPPFVLVKPVDDEHDFYDLLDEDALPAVQAGHLVFTDFRTNYGSVYAATECLRLLDDLYALLP